ncbi:hypothetical protein B0H11DRAFT_2216213 [Mycena galericulata]|nr:hypothetical protein B0H11DRAFT_2216213 [Mycena galericulata]
MSTKQELPVDQPPPLYGELVNDRHTPLYVLAWVCPRKLFENLGGGKLGTVSDRNLRDVISKKWGAWPDFAFSLEPMPWIGGDGNYYLIAMFNKRETDHLQRVLDVAEDPLLQSARVSVGVDQDPSLEETLQWFRFPLYWVEDEERIRKRASKLARVL